MRSHLGTGDFFRARFGIGRPPGRQDAADYVLRPIPASLREDYAVETSRVADAVEALLVEGLDLGAEPLQLLRLAAAPPARRVGVRAVGVRTGPRRRGPTG